VLISFEEAQDAAVGVFGECTWEQTAEVIAPVVSNETSAIHWSGVEQVGIRTNTIAVVTTS
jgi:hypothetical protein